MDLKNIQKKIKHVKELINIMERKSIEIITASAELEFKYKKALGAKEVSYHAASELLTLEKKIDKLLETGVVNNKQFV